MNYFVSKNQLFRTVVNKVDGIATKYRNFEIELVAGEENYLTTVTERGINYKMDFSKVFWNSRLQHEHERVTQFLTNNSLGTISVFR